MKSYEVETIIIYLILAVAVVLSIFGFVALYKAASSDGRVDYCYVDNVSGPTGGYQVIGHRPWRPDTHIGVAGSPEAANEILKSSALCNR